jgi:hypothetical protein
MPFRRACAHRETLPIAGIALRETRFDGLYVGQKKGRRFDLRR